jgi:hypothetical protein
MSAPRSTRNMHSSKPYSIVSLRLLLVLGTLNLTATGCYSLAYHSRKAASDHNETAIDWNRPHSAIEWGTWWGVGYTWEPIGCSYDDGTTHIVAGTDEDKECVHYYALCEKGIGRVEVQPVAYYLPLTVLTLGAFFPTRVTAYCSTESKPSTPSGPTGPTSHLQGPRNRVVASVRDLTPPN